MFKRRNIKQLAKIGADKKTDKEKHLYTSICLVREFLGIAAVNLRPRRHSNRPNEENIQNFTKKNIIIKKNVVLVHVMKACAGGGERRKDLQLHSFFNFGITGKKNPRYSFSRTLGWTPEQVWRSRTGKRLAFVDTSRGSINR